MEDGLPKDTAPVRTINDGYTRTIYDGYLRIRSAKRRGDPSVKDQVAEQFKIADWEWPRLKVVYEAALAGDAVAIDLVLKIDAGTIKITQAYEAHKQELRDRAAAMDLPKRLRLSEIYDFALRSGAFAENTSLALRRGTLINVNGMNAKDVAGCVAQLRAASKYIKDTADQITRQVGGTE